MQNEPVSWLFSDAPNVPAGQASLHVDLRSNTSVDPTPPNVAVNTPSSVSNLTNSFPGCFAGSDSFNPVIDPANVLGFYFDDGTSSLNFTSVELFHLPTHFLNSSEFHVDVDGNWVFEANSAANLPYTFQEFGGVDAFQVLFDSPLAPTSWSTNIRLQRLIRRRYSPVRR